MEQKHKPRVAVTLSREEHARLVREAAERSIQAGRPIAVAAIARELLLRGARDGLQLDHVGHPLEAA